MARLTVVALATASLVVVPNQGDGPVADPSQACDVATRKIFLYAEELPPGPDGRPRLGWGTTPDNASIPGPLLEMYEGECMAITVVNDIPEATLAQLRDDPAVGSQDPSMPLGVSLHVHGVKYTEASDGTIHTSSFVPSGQSRTYFWYASPRVAVAGRIVDTGTAGYWWYHDHVIGTDHGTGGLYSGLFGGLVVRRPGDLLPDVQHTVVMGPNATINLERSDEEKTILFKAREGQRVEFIVIGVGDDFHTFHLHGHNWANNRTGILQSQADETALIDAKTIGPSESFGFQLLAGQNVGTGHWMLHCHVQFHSDVGRFSFFEVEPSDGVSLPSRVQAPADHVHYGRKG